MSIKININDKQFGIPDRLTVDQYHKAIQFDWADPKYYPMIISQLTGAPLPVMIEADDEILHLGMGFVVKSMNDRKECEMLDLEGITFGQWVDLDVYLTGGLDTNFKSIIDILTPKAKWADEAMWAIDQYAAYRMYTYRQYAVLFGLDDRKLLEDQMDVPQDKLAVARSWYKIIADISNMDVLRMDDITEQPLKKILNFMALKKEYEREEAERRLKEQRAKQRARQ